MLLVAALKELEVKATDIKNDLLTAPNKEKYYIISGTEFRVHKSKCFMVVKELYVLKSAGTSFRSS